MTKYEIIKQEIKEQIKDNILKPNQVIKSVPDQGKGLLCERIGRSEKIKNL